MGSGGVICGSPVVPEVKSSRGRMGFTGLLLLPLVMVIPVPIPLPLALRLAKPASRKSPCGNLVLVVGREEDLRLLTPAGENKDM